MADWKDEPSVREAAAQVQRISAILALPEETAKAGLTAEGLYPVSVAHGYLDGDQAAELITGRLPAAARRLGCRYRTGGDDATTFLFLSCDAAVEFQAEATGFAESWWTVTLTPQPVYNRGGLW